jgi:hypothetical protein
MDISSLGCTVGMVPMRDAGTTSGWSCVTPLIPTPGGDIGVTGGVGVGGDIVVSGNYFFATPQPGAVFVPAAGFAPRLSGGAPVTPYFVNSFAMRPYYEQASPTFPKTLDLVASVILPHGVTLTAFRCYQRDADPAVDFAYGSTASLYRFTRTTAEIGFITSVSLATSGTSGDYVASSSLVGADIVVNNLTDAFGISVNWTQNAMFSTSFDYVFRGCVVEYETTTVAR